VVTGGQRRTIFPDRPALDCKGERMKFLQIKWLIAASFVEIGQKINEIIRAINELQQEKGK
jgi:hypothetical protein